MYSVLGSTDSGPSFSLHEDDNGPPKGDRKQPMVELIESNTKLNHDLDQVRKEYKQCLDDIESTNENTEQIVLEERVTIEEQTKNAIEEQEVLLKKLETAQSEDLVKIQIEEQKSKEMRDQAHERLRVAQESANERYSQFMVRCGEYRIKIQQLALQGECLGMKQNLAPLLACAVLQGHNYQDPTKDGEHMEAVSNTLQNSRWEQNFDSIVVSLWESAGLADAVEEDEDELNEALKELEKQKGRTEIAQTKLKNILKEKNVVVEEREKRDNEKKNVMGQFHRLNDDVIKLRSQIETIQQQTKEANGMTLAYKTSVESMVQKREATTAAARTIGNPYTKGRTSDSAPIVGVGDGEGTISTKSRTITPQPNTRRSRKKIQYTQDGRNSNVKRARRSTTPLNQAHCTGKPPSTQQFPHRAGRVRSSRFGASLRVSNLGIMRPPNGDENEGDLPRSGPNNVFQNSESEEEERFTVEQRRSEPIQISRCAATAENNDTGMEEDEDEDTLFSYVAFPKKK
ncbi:hypothetical protein IV203_029938 [Nitzschia inconspicua]|uniref:Uncharacterized protein n=1 Tax=Nitzschia inconspicua TaxID=303405 RepID=A0A9K3LS24_9STRA|nr:hypothetical protein IV203_029938 [Nitzschia inconspicua]